MDLPVMPSESASTSKSMPQIPCEGISSMNKGTQNGVLVNLHGDEINCERNLESNFLMRDNNRSICHFFSWRPLQWCPACNAKAAWNKSPVNPGNSAWNGALSKFHSQLIGNWSPTDKIEWWYGANIRLEPPAMNSITSHTLSSMKATPWNCKQRSQHR